MIHCLRIPKRRQSDLADRLCDAIKHLTAERSSRSHGAQWIMLHDVARHLGISDDEAQRAVALAVERGWLTTDGGNPPAQGRGHHNARRLKETTMTEALDRMIDTLADRLTG